MKSKLVIIFSIAIVSNACKKYNCECNAYAAGSLDSGGKTNYTVKKKNRVSNCTGRSTTADAFGNYTVCEIK